MSEIYQWTDENGQTHFGDRAPNNSQAKDISKQTQQINISSDMSSPEMMLKHQKSQDAERVRRYKEWQQTQESKPKKEEVCAEARNASTTINGRVIFLDENGEAMKVTEAERIRRAAELDAFIEKHCQ